MADLTIACVLRSGGHYDPIWVRKLARQCEYYAPSHRFVCLSDVEIPGIETAELLQPWPTWWSKIELFRPGLFDGRVVYFDLDTLVVDALDDVCAYAGPFATLSDFYQLRRPATGAMTWSGDENAYIFEALKKKSSGFAGRMDYWLQRVADPPPERLQGHFPGQFVSLKAHAREGPPEGARVVCFHGRPRCDDPKAGWAHRVWQAA